MDPNYPDVFAHARTISLMQWVEMFDANKGRVRNGTLADQAMNQLAVPRTSLRIRRIGKRIHRIACGL